MMLAKQWPATCALFFLWALLQGGLSTARATETVAFDLSTTTLLLAEEAFGEVADGNARSSAATRVTLTLLSGRVEPTEAVRIHLRLPNCPPACNPRSSPEAVRLGLETPDGALVRIIGSQQVGRVYQDGQNPLLPLVPTLEGNAGQNRVTLGVGILGHQPAMEAGSTITITIPSVHNLPLDLSRYPGRVLVSTFIEPYTSDFIDFIGTADPGNFLADGVNGNTITSNVLINVVSQYSVSVSGPDDADATNPRISRTDATRFAEGGATPVSYQGENRAAFHLGDASWQRDNTPMARVVDGSADFFALADEDRLRLAIEVDSNDQLAPYDFAFVDLNGDENADENELFSPSSDGDWVRSYPVGGSEATALMEPRAVYLVSSGTRNLLPDAYGVSLTLDFDDATYRDETATGPSIEVEAAPVAFDLSTTTLLLAEEAFGEVADGNAQSSSTTRITLTLISGRVEPGHAASITFQLPNCLAPDCETRSADAVHFGLEGMDRFDRVIDFEQVDLIYHDGRNLPFNTKSQTEGLSGQARVSVLFQVSPARPAMEPGSTITLTIPSLQNLPRDLSSYPARVSVSIDPTHSLAEGDSFRTAIPLTDGEDGNTITNDVLIDVVSQYSVSVTGPGADVPTPGISQTDPTSFIEDTASEISFQGQPRAAVYLGDAGWQRDDTPMARVVDGSDDFFALADEDRLRLAIEVDSNDQLAPYDFAFVDLDGDGNAEQNEMFSLSPDGDWVKSEAPDGPMANALMEPRSVYLVLSGTRNLRAASYGVSLTLDFDDATYQDETATGPNIEVESAVTAFDLSTTPLLLAEEAFGEVADGNAQSSRATRVTLTLISGRVEPGHAARITFQLPNCAPPCATTRTPEAVHFGLESLDRFTRVIDFGNVDLIYHDGQNLPFNLSITEGFSGQSRVNARFQVSPARPAMEPGSTITLTIPNLQNLPLDLDSYPARMSVSFDPQEGDSFPELAPLADGEDGNTITSDVLIDVVSQYSVSVGGPDANAVAPRISPTDATRFVEGTAVQVSYQEETRAALYLGDAGWQRDDTPPARVVDGSDDLFAISNEDRLILAIQVNSSELLSPYDFAFVDLDGDGVVDENEMTSASATGAWTQSFTVGSPEADALMEARRVYLVSSGTRGLLPASYGASLTLDFDDASYRDETTVGPSTRLSYSETGNVRFEMDTTPLRLADELLVGEPLTVAGTQQVALTVIGGTMEPEQSGSFTISLPEGTSYADGPNSGQFGMQPFVEVRYPADELANVLGGTIVEPPPAGQRRLLFTFTLSDSQPTLGPGGVITITLPAIQLSGAPSDYLDNRMIRAQVDLAPHGDDSYFRQAVTLADGAGGHRVVGDALLELVDQVILEASPAASAAALSRRDRSSLANPDPANRFRIDRDRDGNSIPVIMRDAIHLANLAIRTAEPPAKLADGRRDFGLAAGDRLRVSVTGDFTGFTSDNYPWLVLDHLTNTQDDLRLISHDANEPFASPEDQVFTFTAQPNGALYPLLLQMEPDSGAGVFLIFPENGPALTPRLFRVSMSLEYADAGFRDEDAVSAGTRLTVEQPEGNVQFSLDTTPLQLAAEILGGRTPALTGAQTVTLQVRGDSGVSGGGTATLTYMLEGGVQFGMRDLVSDDLKFLRDPFNTGSFAFLTLLSGGRVGDTRAVFEVGTGRAQDDSILALYQGDRLQLTLPGLQNLDELRDGDTFGMQVAIHPDQVTGGFNFRTLNPLTDGEDGSVILGNTLVRVGRQFILNAEGPDIMPTIHAQRRTEFDRGGLVITLADGSEYQGIHLGKLGMTKAETRFKLADGRTDFVLSDADLLHITLAGDSFHARAHAFIDLNGNLVADDAETIPLTDGLSLPGTGSAATALRTANRGIYLLTNGDATLEPTTYTARLELDFANDGYLDSSVRTPPTTLFFSGIPPQGFAYAMPNCTQVEGGRISITNELQRPLRVFMQGVDQGGRDLGMVELDASLLRGAGGRQFRAHETLQLLTEQVEQLFQLDEGGDCVAADTWQGRAQLTFFTDGNITVLPQIRGAAGEARDLGGFTGLEAGAGRITNQVGN